MGKAKSIFSYTVLLLALILLVGCERRADFLGSRDGDLAPDEVDTSLPTTARISASNGIITIEFEFKGQMELEDGSQSWTDE
ncbi:MAG TPA: hypothetical protein DEA96_06525, partial [Leptospiraceae bacterium]|nr:hypothetical protein [Leptospiraceae bacterium]